MNVALTIKMKCWILLVVLIFLICGCSPSHQQENDSIPLISVSHLFEREYIELQKQYVDWSVWGDNIYLLDETGLDCYSDTTGTIRETSISGGLAIDVYDNEKFVIAQDGITVYDAQDTICETYPIIGDAVGDSMFIAASSEWIVYAYRAVSAQFTTYRIFAQDRKDQSQAYELTEQIQGSFPVCVISGLQFTETDQVSVTFFFHPTDTDQIMYMEYSLTDKDIKIRYTVPYTMGYTVIDGFLYCLTNRIDHPQINQYDLLTGEKTALQTFSSETIVRGAGVTAEYPSFSLHVTEQQMFLADLHHKIMYLHPRSPDKASLRIIIPDTGYTGMNFNEQFEGAIAAFSAETGMGVECLALPMETYEDKISAKLLAGDEDFDLYVLPNTIQSQMVSNIVEKNAYMPLEQYDHLLTSFDELYEGFAESVMHNGHIYGLPIWMSYSSLRINRALFSEYDLPIPDDRWTLDDVWTLCEIIENRQLPVRVFCNGQAQILQLITASLEYNDFDRDELISLFENIRRYGNAQVLFYENDPPRAERLSQNEDLDALFYLTYGLPATPNLKNLHADTSDLIPYPRAEREAPHYIRAYDMILMNANTAEADAAARFLAIMYVSDEEALEDIRRDSLNPYEASLMENGKLYVVFSDALLSGTEEIYYELLYGETDAGALADQYYEMIQYHVHG